MIVEKVINAIDVNSMFKPKDKVIVAVSGGPDSICLLNILCGLRSKFEIEIFVAHVNHCLRGIEADKDEEYVHSFCRKLNIECYSKKIDINNLAKINNVSSETAGRDARYSFFNELKKELGADKIALAHNANDQAETILMRIIRGTGIEGLIGIKPIRDNVFIRPLINITRKEIEKYCEIKGLMPRIDKTNLENIYTRNKVRLELIPYLEQNFNSDIINGLIRLGITAKSDNDYIEKQVDLKYKKYCNRKAGKVIISDEAFKEEEAIISRIIRRAFGEVNASINDFEKIHIYDIISIHKQGTGKEISLPKGTKAKNNYGDIIIEKKSPNNLEEAFDFCLRLEETNIIPQANIKVNLKIIENMNDLKLKASADMRNFDFDKIQGEITIRNRRDGDKFIPLGMRGSKKLKDLFIDLKIEKTERDKIPLICFGGDIAWIVGYRTSEKYKISENTKKILQIRLESEC